MPELPEVEIVRIGLEELIVGKKFANAKSSSPRSFPNSQASVDGFLIGSKVIAVRRRAKVLLIDLDTDYTLMIHLRMTGQLVFVGESRFGAGHPNDSLVSNLPDKSTRVEMFFDDNSELFFNDQRKFGWVRLLPTELVVQDPFMMKVGPEPLEGKLTNNIFIQRMRKRNGTTVKAAILDQTTLAGVGNIYADESLWIAKIHPAERVKNIGDEQLKNLRAAIIGVMKLSIQKGGSTSETYVNAEGGKGSYLDFANVFRRENLPCLRCGAVIEKSRVAGRGTHTCPVCQIIH